MNPVTESSPAPRGTVSPVAQVSQNHTSPILIILLLLVFLSSTGAAAFLYIQNMGLKNQLAELTATPEVTPTPTPVTDPTADWKTYTNSAAMYSIKYPTDWKIGSVAAGSTGQIGTDARYIQLSPPQDGNGNFGIEELQVIPPSEQASLTITKIVNGITLKCNGNFTSDAKTWCWVKVPNQESYLNIQIFKGSDEAINSIFDQILSTFQFTDPSEASAKGGKFTCPAGEWVDCMPILDEAGQKRCAPEAITWYKANCPMFKGAAL